MYLTRLNHSKTANTGQSSRSKMYFKVSKQNESYSFPSGLVVVKSITGSAPNSFISPPASLRKGGGDNPSHALYATYHKAAHGVGLSGGTGHFFYQRMQCILTSSPFIRTPASFIKFEQNPRVPELKCPLYNIQC